MNLERLRWGEWIAAIAALDLLLVMFRAWYKVSGGDGRVTAWDALEQGRYLLIATAVVGLALWLMTVAEDSSLSFPPGWIAAVVGLACTVYVAYRLASPPSEAFDADIGLYLGLASAVGVAIGGVLSAREPAMAAAGASDYPTSTTADTATAPADAVGGLTPDTGPTWSPAAPAASTSGWSPAAPATSVPPATAAGAAAGERPLQSGDLVVLTAGGARFPAGTVAEVVEAFSGGALVEVRAADGMAERFELPDSAFERTTPGAAVAGAAESWAPAMPAPVTEDWGFDEPSTATADLPGGAADAAEPEPPAKVPWWKREIGGGKKKRDEAADDDAAAAFGAAAVGDDEETQQDGDEKPGFFKRLFGGGRKAEPEADADERETSEAEPFPASDVAGIGQAAESDTGVEERGAEAAYESAAASVVDEPADQSVVDEPEPEPTASTAEGEPFASAHGPEAAAEPEVVASAPEPEAAPEPEVRASAPEPEPAPEPEVRASAPEPEPAPEPEVRASAPEPEPAPESEPAPARDTEAAEPEVVPEPGREPEAGPPAVEPDRAPPVADPEPVASAPDAAPGDEAAGAAAAPAVAASEADVDEEEPKPKPRPKPRRSSVTRKVPKEVLAGVGAPPKVGDDVQLKVGGGKFDAGTRGTVVDVFSAGVIVEFTDEDGRTERLDLPFEAIGPADA